MLNTPTTTTTSLPHNPPTPSPLAALVHQYLHLVYASALHQTQNPATAEDITQAVFLLLARRSPHFPKENHMAGWLLKTTAYAVKTARRAAIRRHYHERQAALLRDPTASSSDHSLLQSLDHALLRLPATDRELLSRRYLLGQPVHQLAPTLGISENAATKRLTRTLEKLRAHLARHGITTPSASLASTLSSQALLRAPHSTLLATAPGAPISTHTLLLHTLAKSAAALLTLLLLALLGTTFVTHKTPTTPIVSTTPPATLPQAPSTKPFVPKPNEPPPPAVAELEKQIFAARDAITSGTFIAEAVNELLLEGKTLRLREEDDIDPTHFADRRYFTGLFYNGGVDIRCFTPEWVYDYMGSSGPFWTLNIFRRGEETRGLRPYDPRVLMFMPITYFAAGTQERDLIIGAKNRRSFAMEETLWNDQKALRVSFQLILSDRETEVTYLAVPSRSFNIVEMTGSGKENQSLIKCTLKEFAPGIWFPDHVTYSKRKGEVTEEREDLTMQVSRVNQPLDPALFTMKGMNIPIGIRVSPLAPLPPYTPGLERKWDGENIVPASNEDLDRWNQERQELHRAMAENANSPIPIPHPPSPPPPHQPPTLTIPPPK